MAPAKSWKLLVFFLTAFNSSNGQEDSLKSALSAVDRRQRDLSEHPSYSDIYSEGGLSRYSPEDRNRLAFLDKPDARMYKHSALERALLEYLEENGLINPQKKRISSSFRERVEEDKERQREQYARVFLNSLENARDLDDEEYRELLREFLEKYQNYPEEYDNKERTYFTNLMRKRNRYYDPESSDSFYLFNYPPRDDSYNRLQEEDLEDSYEEIDPNTYYDRERRYGSGQAMFTKRFPVSKRSSDFYVKSKENKKTDPKVEKELSTIFGANKKAEKPEKVPSKPKKTETTEVKEKSKVKNKDTKSANTKEVVTSSINKEPLQIKKKSVDWSDYFGFNRKKKSEENLDNEWLMERYHKAVALNTKRSAEYPLQHFVDHDEKPEKEEKKVPKKSEEAKLKEIDEKLRGMEDSILDDTLKYTGAHEGVGDSKEIQEIKERVISRLVAAYNLEKMRRALGEYKLSVAKEVNMLKQQQKQGQNEDYLFTEEKRVSVPRKQAVDEDLSKNHEEENNIKCALGAPCDEQIHRVPTEILDRYTWRAEDCPRVERACNEFATSIGKYERAFEASCNIHQICLLCNDNNWYPPTRKCNALYLAKSYELCEGNEDCQKTARRSISDLLVMNNSLRNELIGECNLVCPENK